MFKILFIALIGYFVLSRLFGRVIIIKKTNPPYSAPQAPKDVNKMEISIEKPRKSGEEYIDYEEVK